MASETRAAMQQIEHVDEIAHNFAQGLRQVEVKKDGKMRNSVGSQNSNRVKTKHVLDLESENQEVKQVVKKIRKKKKIKLVKE